MDCTKDTAAQNLAQAHYDIEPGMRTIVQLLASSQQEADPKEPIKLLEVNENTIASGVHPVFFGPHPQRGLPYWSTIIEVTPEEYEEIRQRPSSLPHGWRLGREIERLSTAKAV